MIFKSKQVNLDPLPSSIFAPRHEFEPTRDRFPYVSEQGTHHAYPGTLNHKPLRWAPRREQFDTPVNRVLGLFRKQQTPAVPIKAHAQGFVNGITRLASEGFSIAEIEHARKVLIRLVRIGAQP